MNAIDVLILIIVGTFAALGLRRGFVLGAVDLGAVAVGLLAAGRSYRSLVDPLVERGAPREIVAPVAFVLLAVAALILASLVVGLLLRPLARLPTLPPLRWLNALLGIGPGAIKGIVLAAIVVVPLAFFQGPLGLGARFAGARLADPLLRVGLDGLYAGLDRFEIDLGDFAVITSRPDGGGIDLPFTVEEGLTPDPSAEAEMLRLVNEERTRAGLEPVVADAGLTGVARAHSEEMFRLGYFAHDSPVTGTPADRLAAAGVRYLLMGENLAFAPTLEIAHERLIGSPTHRANILNPAFTRLGVGVIRSPNRGLMVSQEFAS